MSYQVLARKYRPATFASMVGQQHVLAALTNALTSEKLHHGYIFAGTRGVGKTTIARIFAKCLNNPDGITATPDEHSEVAQAIDRGNFIDLIEVDAASRTKVEQTRELLENIAYPPAQGRFRIYLIDEAHQLSSSSFNALLKTLEEPPEFVKFLFATTEPQKLPITVVSRCLLFNLRQIPENLIRTQLQQILEKEQIGCDDEAIALLAKAGRGSLRDALSITDQAIAHTNGELKGGEIATMLGMLDLAKLEAMVDLLIRREVTELMPLLEDMAGHCPNYEHLIEQLLQLLQQAAIVQFATPTEPPRPIVARIAASLSAEVIQLYYQLLLRGKGELALLENQEVGFAMVILRLLAFSPITSPAIAAAVLNDGNPTADRVPDKASDTQRAVQDQVVQQQIRNETRAAVRLPLPTTNDEWMAIFAHLEIDGFLKQLLGSTSFRSCDASGNLSLNLSESHARMITAAEKRKIHDALQKHIDQPLQLSFYSVAGSVTDSPIAVQETAKASESENLRSKIEGTPGISEILHQFDGKITNIRNPQSSEG